MDMALKNTMKFEKDKICLINLPGHSLDGTAVKMISQSSTTANIKCQFGEARGAYKVGNIVLLMPFELKEIISPTTIVRDG